MAFSLLGQLTFQLTSLQTLPMAYLTFSTVMCIIGIQCPFILIQFGWLVSWIWLPFYKKNSSDTCGGGPTDGERTGTLALVNSIPPRLHGVPITRMLMVSNNRTLDIG